MMEHPDDNESLPSMSGRAELRAVRRTVAQEEPHHAGSGPQPAFSRAAHVLAVDDDPAMRAMIAPTSTASKLSAVTVVLVFLGGAVTLLTVTADIVNPIRLQ